MDDTPNDPRRGGDLHQHEYWGCVRGSARRRAKKRLKKILDPSPQWAERRKMGEHNSGEKKEKRPSKPSPVQDVDRKAQSKIPTALTVTYLRKPELGGKKSERAQ